MLFPVLLLPVGKWIQILIYTTVEKFGVDKMYEGFWKKSLMLTKANQL